MDVRVSRPPGIVSCEGLCREEVLSVRPPQLTAPTVLFSVGIYRENALYLSLPVSLGGHLASSVSQSRVVGVLVIVCVHVWLHVWV
jgi:hypothetical protein